MTEIHDEIFAILRRRREKDKIPGVVLAEKLNITPRKLRDCIEEMRNEGIPIGSSWRVGDSGYWLITDVHRLAEWIAGRHKWLTKQHKTIEKMKKFYITQGGQMDMLNELIDQNTEN